MNNTSETVRLYAIPTSPYAIKVSCYLAYKKIDYQVVGVSPITFKQVAFTKKHQVPVLQIGEEWKIESSDIGVWLEERFPAVPILPPSRAEREKIMALDHWVTDRLIPSGFRLVVDWPSMSIGLRNGWRLSRAVDETTRLPRWVRFLWPVLLRRAKFIVALVDTMDRTQSLAQYQQTIIKEFVERLDSGPYLGGRNEVSLADLSAYALIVYSHRFGLQGNTAWMENAVVAEWAAAVDKHMPDNPFLVDDKWLKPL